MISSRAVADTIRQGYAPIICGNGGSMAQAQHLTAELIGLGYPALALSDPTVLSALTNDFDSHTVFARYLYAYADLFKLFIGFTTSGSGNVLLAAQEADEQGMDVVLVTGEGVHMPAFCDMQVQFPGDTQKIQEQTLDWIHDLYAWLRNSA